MLNVISPANFLANYSFSMANCKLETENKLYTKTDLSLRFEIIDKVT